jgi:hypothetical protein
MRVWVLGLDLNFGVKKVRLGRDAHLLSNSLDKRGLNLDSLCDKQSNSCFPDKILGLNAPRQMSNANFSEPAEQAIAYSLGWSEALRAKPQVTGRILGPKPVKRAPAVTHANLLPPASRAKTSITLQPGVPLAKPRFVIFCVLCVSAVVMKKRQTSTPQTHRDRTEIEINPFLSNSTLLHVTEEQCCSLVTKKHFKI